MALLATATNTTDPATHSTLPSTSNHHHRCHNRSGRRLSDISQAARQLLGGDINLSSASQVAHALYTQLRLPPPKATGGRSAAKTHTPTDEASLRQLASLHALPGLVLEHRCLNNIATKWLQPGWVLDAAGRAAAAGRPWARVRCSWNQTSTATGRLSSSSPNLQAVTKYTVTAVVAAQQTPAGGAAAAPSPGGNGGAATRVAEINIRDAFIAPFGDGPASGSSGYGHHDDRVSGGSGGESCCSLLLAADYSQIELRLLAHMSGDEKLTALLRRAGAQGDAFSLIAANWLRCGLGPDGRAGREDRERAKRVTYGIIYGLTPYGLAAQLAEEGAAPDYDAASRLITSFLAYFSGVKRFIEESRRTARANGYVTTLLGRRRPIAGLDSSVASTRAEAERKVVNSAVQGSAADLIKLAMCRWSEWAAAALGSAGGSGSGSGCWEGAAARGSGRHRRSESFSHLVGQIHDELLFEVSNNNSDAGGAGEGGGSEAAAAAAGAGSPSAMLVPLTAGESGAAAALAALRQAAASAVWEGDGVKAGHSHCRLSRHAAVVATAVRSIMEGVVQLDVPLVVNVAAGARWGSMQAITWPAAAQQ